jgi:hypothetical protein
LSHSISPLLYWFFRDRVSQSICLGWLQTTILLISAPWVARITSVCHWLRLEEIVGPSSDLNPLSFRDNGTDCGCSCGACPYTEHLSVLQRVEAPAIPVHRISRAPWLGLKHNTVNNKPFPLWHSCTNCECVTAIVTTTGTLGIISRFMWTY